MVWKNFAGCAVVISHDRWFLDRIATHILSLKAIQKLNISKEAIQNMKNSKKKFGNVEPKRIKFKKLTAG